MIRNPRRTEADGAGARRRAFWRRGAARRPAGDMPAQGAVDPARDEAGRALAALEDVLVAQLRLAQTLDALAEQERLALTMDSPEALAEVVRARLSCVNELARLEHERDSAVQAWAQQADLAADVAFEDILPHLEPAEAQRLSVYRLGIEAHLEHSRALRPANRALARTAVARHEEWQRFLLRQAAGSSLWPSEGSL